MPIASPHLPIPSLRCQCTAAQWRARVAWSPATGWWRADMIAKPDFGDLNCGTNRAGYVIHGALREARSEAGCIVHAHSRAWIYDAVVLRNHGAIVVGRTCGEAFNWVHRLDPSHRD